jgi:hypothetical protein
MFLTCWMDMMDRMKALNGSNLSKCRGLPNDFIIQIPNQAWPSQETNMGPISSTTSLQPNQLLPVVLRNPHRTLPSWTIVATASKLGHNIWTHDPSLLLHLTTTQPTGPHGNRWGIWACQFTGILVPCDPSMAIDEAFGHVNLLGP